MQLMYGQTVLPDYLVNLGAVAGLIAAGAWWRAWRKATTNNAVVKVNAGDADNQAKLLSAIALGLVSLGYLWGKVAGAV